MKQGRSFEMDMCHGPLLGKLIRFSIPLVLSGILQLLFNAADIIVVGRFAGSQSLAAVGSTSSLINLLVNLFLGLSVGANVLVGRYYGAKDEKHLQRTIHTSILLSLISGVILAVLGILIVRPLLELMGTPDDVLGLAVLYMRIYFLGMPVLLLYNFASAILRAVGDTKRPLFYLSAAGCLNIVLNLFFVIVFHMDVAGVALATVISECLSAILLFRCLTKMEGGCRLYPKKLRIHREELIRILQVGLPAGIQSSIFSVSNVLIQASVNSFGTIAIAGNAASSNLENFIYIAMNAIYQTALSFTSQNYGGGQHQRIGQILRRCWALVVGIGVILGGLVWLFGRPLLGIYTTESDVVDYGMIRLGIITRTYFLCGLMDVTVGSLRGLGYSVMPTIVSLIGACGLRIVWVYTLFAMHRSLQMLYISYPVSWLITFATHAVCYFLFARKRIQKAMA